MKIKELQILYNISRTNNVSASARSLGLSQSALSHSMKKLEKEWGIPLWKRQGNGVQLSSQAKLLLPDIEETLAHVAKLQKDIDAISGLQKGQLTIATYSSIAMHWLPDLIGQYQSLYPGIQIRIREGNVDEIAQWLQEGKADLAFFSKVEEYPCTFYEMATDPLVAVVNRDFPLKDEWKDAFPIEAFRQFPYIASETGVDIDVSRAFLQAGFQPPVRFTCKEDQTILAMVKNGLGITLLPSLMLEGIRDVKAIPLREPVIRTLGIGFLKEEDLSLATRCFIEMIQEEVEPK